MMTRAPSVHSALASCSTTVANTPSNLTFFYRRVENLYIGLWSNRDVAWHGCTARLESYGKNELTAEKPQDMIAPDVDRTIELGWSVHSHEGLRFPDNRLSLAAL
jgi:hypothetical protein